MQKYLQLLDDRLHGRHKLNNEGVRYVGLNTRVLATLTDMFLILMLLTPILLFVPMPNFDQPMNNMPPGIAQAYRDHGEGKITDEEFRSAVMPYFRDVIAPNIISGIVLNILIAGVIFILCWKRWNATPGKMLFRLKIADSKTFTPPSTSQYIMRYLGYFIAGIPLGLGFFIIGFNRRKRGLHDFIADTVVIYSTPLNPEAERKKRKWQVYIGLLVFLLAIYYLSKRM